MKRILLVASVIAAITGTSAAPASAGVFGGDPTVCTPASHNTGTPSEENSQAPPREERATLPNNDGTRRAEENSPAIEECCGGQS
jgi:hypothetical protein